MGLLEIQLQGSLFLFINFYIGNKVAGGKAHGSRQGACKVHRLTHAWSCPVVSRVQHRVKLVWVAHASRLCWSPHEAGKEFFPLTILGVSGFGGVFSQFAKRYWVLAASFL